MSTKQKKNIRLRVAIIHCGFIYSGGGERIVIEEAIGLRKLGYKVDVYAPTYEKDKCFPDLIGEVRVKTFFPSYYKFPFSNALRMIVSSFLAPFMAYKFRKYDILIGANQPSVWIAYCISRLLNKPYIIYLNQPNRVIYPRPVDVKYGWYTTVKDYQFLYNLLRIFRIPLEYLDRISVRNAAVVMTNGSYIGGIIENIYSKDVFDNPAGSRVQSSRNISRSEDLTGGEMKMCGTKWTKPYALITNRHDPQKRFDYVIEAMKILKKKKSKLKLIIPGPFTKHTNELKLLTTKLGLDGTVIFLGVVSDKELQLLYKNALVYCYPSPEEDFGLGPLEAGSWGVPTVAWDNGGPTVTIENNVTGILARPNDVNDYAQKMHKISTNLRLREKMGRCAWERTLNLFSWQRHNKTIDSIIKDVIH